MASDTCFIHHSRGWKYSHGLLKKYLVVSRVEWPRSPRKKNIQWFQASMLKTVGRPTACKCQRHLLIMSTVQSSGFTLTNVETRDLNWGQQLPHCPLCFPAWKSAERSVTRCVEIQLIEIVCEVCRNVNCQHFISGDWAETHTDLFPLRRRWWGLIYLVFPFIFFSLVQP